MPRPDLSDLAARLRRPPLTRFAPSPTGYLHLGHVVNAIYVWGLARALGGRVLLRVEDHDRIRSRPQFEEGMLEDLDWLGFTADIGRQPLVRQSDRTDAYEDALSQLRTSGCVYACECSRKDIAGEYYAGRCRDRRLDLVPGRGLRVRIDEGTEEFWDGLRGLERQTPAAEFGDLLVRDRQGHWTYQFAVTVDDYRDGVTLVVRGADLLPSTGRQLRLARMLGRSNDPLFVHHPLLMDGRGRKLSKSDGAAGIRQLRQAGIRAEEVIGRAALLAGLVAARRPVAASEVHTLFQG
jgi:glutamyl-tRNA synthetase/glutamyl-Q tRNA(Asp) synthetase